jgi:hypothetical protein
MVFLSYHPKSVVVTVAGVPELIARSLWTRRRPAIRISRSVTKNTAAGYLESVVQFATQGIGYRSRIGRSIRESINQWVRQEQSHDSTRQTLGREIHKLQSGHLLPEKAFYLSSLLSGLGQFEASLMLHNLGRAQVIRQVEQVPTFRNQIRGLQSFIFEGDAARAKSAATGLLNTIRSSNQQEALYGRLAILFRYLETWLDCSFRLAPDAAGSDVSDWNLWLDGASCVVFGPGAVGNYENLDQGESKVFRSAAPGSYSWDQSSDLFAGRVDGVYLTPENLSYLMNDTESRRKLQAYNWVLVKKSSKIGLENLRIVDNRAWLFLTGHINIVPLATLDLVASGASGVYILASDFFASGNNYRVDSLRRFDNVTRIDSTGSYGGEFDRCGTFASHNLLENRQLVKNLVNANKVTGDEFFLDAIDMSEAEYATRLDSLYGSTRL